MPSSAGTKSTGLLLTTVKEIRQFSASWCWTRAGSQLGPILDPFLISVVPSLVQCHDPSARPQTGEVRFSLQVSKKIGRNLDFRALGSCRIDPYRNFLFLTYRDPFRPKSSFLQPFSQGFRRLPRVSGGFQGFPKGFQGFPRVSKGFQGFPMVSDGFRMFLIFHFFDFSGPSQMFGG